MVDNPDYFLMYTILNRKFGQTQFCDFSKSSVLTQRIIDSDELTYRAIENYKKRIFSTDFSDEDIESIRNFGNHCSHRDGYIEGSAECLGIVKELETTRAIRQQKIDEIAALVKAEKLQKAEEQKRMKEAENMRLKEVAQQKLSALNPHLKIEKVEWGYVHIKFESGLKRTPKAIREAAEVVCKRFGWRFERSEKIWKAKVEDITKITE